MGKQRSSRAVTTYCVVVPSSTSSSSGGEYYPVMLTRNGVEYPVTLRRVVDDDNLMKKIFKVRQSILSTSIQSRRAGGVFFVSK